MLRPDSAARSDGSDDHDLDGLAEAELEKLQRNYRLMEGDRKAYVQESRNIITRQKKEIENLEGEKGEIMKDLRIIVSANNQNKDEINIGNLESLSKEKNDIKSAVENELKRQEQVNAELKEWEKKIKQQHKNMGGVHMSRIHNTQVQRNITRLENQLQLVNNSFCEMLEVNRGLRDEIDSLRIERNRFETLYKKLEKELNQRKQEKTEIIDHSTQAFNTREEAQAKMIQLKEKADKDVLQHNGELKELTRIIDHDRKLKTFMNTKTIDRPEDPLLVEWRVRKEIAESERKKACQTDTVESYEDAFKRIKEITGEDDLDLLVKIFIENEDKNFALFNFVNEQNNEIVYLQETIEEKKNDIDNFKEEGVELEERRENILKELEAEKEKAILQEEEHKEKLESISKITEQLKTGVDSLFNKINCDRKAIDDMLGDQTGVTDQNLLQYLGSIEEKTNKLLLISEYVESQLNYEEFMQKRTELNNETYKSEQNTLRPLAPSVLDEYGSNASEESEDEQNPLSLNLITNKVMKKRDTLNQKKLSMIESPKKK